MIKQKKQIDGGFMSNYTAICDHCGGKTFHTEDQPCKRTIPVYCKCCGHSTGKMRACPGTLRLIDNSNLNPIFDKYYKSGERIEVSFCDESGTEYERKRGTIGKTTGWKPCYLLMLTKRSIGSSYTIGKNDKVIKVI